MSRSTKTYSILRKQGKHNKSTFHKRFFSLEGNTLKVYQKEKHHTQDRTPKHTLNMKHKRVKTAKSIPSKTKNCFGKFVERFFVKVTDSVTGKTDMLIEVAIRVQGI